MRPTSEPRRTRPTLAAGSRRAIPRAGLVAAGLSLASAGAVVAKPSKKADEGPRVLAVFDLEIRGDTLEASAADAMADTLATWMGEGGRYRVVPRSDLRKALAKAKRDSYKDCFAESCQIEVGQALAADATLAARVVQIGRRCLVNLKIFDLRTEATLRTISRRGACSEDGIFDSLERAARKLTGAPSDALHDPARAPTPSRPVPTGRVKFKKARVKVRNRVVTVDAFEMDKTEVTVRAYRKCVEAGRCDEGGLADMSTCTYGRPGRDGHPLNCVTWAQADRYCAWAGGRLPTEAEWALAAGAARSPYPWGRLGFRKGRPANVADRAANRQYDLASRREQYDDGQGATAQVGSFTDGVSKKGLFDLVGNVAEWTNDWHVKGRSRVIRGASWRTPVSEASSRSRGWVDATSREDDVGFRCVLTSSA